MSGTNYNYLSQPVVANPVAAIQAGNQAASSLFDAQTKRFNLQQAQNQLGYDAMRRLMATNSNPSYDDIVAAAGEARAMGGNTDGLVSNLTAFTGRGGKPADFVRAYSLGGMSPETQGTYVYPQYAPINTGSQIVMGMRGGAATPNAGVWTPTGSSIQLGFTPEQAGELISVPETDASGNPTGRVKMVPRGQLFGTGVPGGGQGGAAAPGGAAGTGQAASGSNASLLPPGQPYDVAAARIDQIGQRESGNRNIPNQQGPGGTSLSSASGPYQFLDSTWQQAAKEYGIQNPTPRAMQTDPAIQRAVAIAFLQRHGEAPWAMSAAPSGGGTATAPAAAGPFVGATSAQPVTAGTQTAPGRAFSVPSGAVQQTGGGGIAYDQSGRPIQQGGGGAAPGGFGGFYALPPGYEQVVQPQIKRASDLQQAMAAGVNTRAILEGMRAELNNLPTTGVTAGVLGTIRNAVASTGLFSQQTVDQIASIQSKQEQFEKFAALLQQAQLGALTGQATDERQALTAASTPSILHTKLGNLGILNMLQGNQSALQVMGRAYQADVNSGRATPQNFDAWRNQFTQPDANGARFDPRVFWMAQMDPRDQKTYGRGLTDRDAAQLRLNVQYAVQHGWIKPNADGSFRTDF